ncbi:phosphoenolpyruvate mutase [Pantoea sp. S61]|uniref:phosphoenolpyruvate mutase n=1 Tax=Pantoea sp. S61 TaxID=2767442 RepID=UPI00190BE9E4|nr:phosphoenolpyruvate mutase [Pantoea sp. S61]MBK0123597.1 phosphoenolpyruvate mutase [Pantoea sp. S61]
MNKIPTINDSYTHQNRCISKLSNILRSELLSPELSFIMEAHDGLSAAIAQRAGFKSLWASGLSISTSLGYRDTNEASWTEIVDVVERIVYSSSLPVLVDADGGFGNFNNARLCATKLLQRGAAGICIEDKTFPKTNSFIGNKHELADIKEFSGRLQAVKDSVGNDLVVVARTEALIAGHPMEEALARAHAYADAGVDAVLIHSRLPRADEIVDFLNLWDSRLPVIIVPTKYYMTPTQTYRDANVSAVIWANHSMRAAASHMTKICKSIAANQSIAQIENDISSLDEIFSLLNYDQLKEDEKFYFPKS